VQSVGFPTRVTDRTARTIDLVWGSTRLHCRRAWGVTGLSDHDGVLASINPPRSTPIRHARSRRVWKLAELELTPEINLPRGDSLEASLVNWEKYSRVLTQSFTFVRRARRRSDAPWATPHIRRLCRWRTAEVKAARFRPRTEFSSARIKKARGEVRQAIRAAKEEHVQRLLAVPGGILGKGFAAVKRLLGRKCGLGMVPQGTPDEWNEFLLAKVEDIRNNIRSGKGQHPSPPSPAPPPIVASQHTPLCPLPLPCSPSRPASDPATPRPPPSPVLTPHPTPPPSPSFAFRPTIEAEVLAAIKHAPPSLAPGTDRIPMRVVRSRARDVIPWLVNTINQLVLTGIWPDAWKEAEVAPTYKGKGPRHDKDSYRSISLLQAVSRVAERVLLLQLRPHLEAHVLPSCQHGFRTGHSTVTHLTELVDTTAMARDRGFVVCILSLDLTKAFNTVDHSLLLKKLTSSAGLHEWAVALICSYLSGRRQRVRLPWATGGWRPVKVGVPEGSVLGPALFSAYTADMPDEVTAGELFLFADDTTVLAMGRGLEEALSVLRTAIGQVEEYLRQNYIALNGGKNQLLVVGSTEFPTVPVGGVLVKATATIKILGIEVDRDLKWEEQTERGARLASAVGRNIRRSLRGVPPELMGKLMRVMAHPYLDTGLVATTSPSKRAEEALERAYNRTARLATWRGPRDLADPVERGYGRTTPALELLKWPTWAERRRAITEAFAMKVWVLGQPSGLRGRLPHSVTHTHSTRLRTRPEVRPVERGKTRVSAKAFSQWAPAAITAVLSETPPEPADQGEGKGVRTPPRPDGPEVAAFHGYLRYTFRERRETEAGGRVVVWTDGSAVGGRAGAGLFYGNGNRLNAAIPVGGGGTAQRAEVTALWHLLETEERPVAVRSDSRYVVNGATEGRTKWRSRAWYASPALARRIPHADLWHRIDARLEFGGRDAVFSHVKAHASLERVRAGDTTEEDAWGNGGADRIAKWAALGGLCIAWSCPDLWHG